jgi:signal transduction histidine kinase
VIAMSRRALFDTQWGWVLPAGAAVAAVSFGLMFFMVTLCAAILRILSGGELDRARLDSFADFMAVWGLPALYALLTAGAAAWLARRAVDPTPWQGLMVGLVSAGCLQVIGLAFGPPMVREVIVYTLLGATGGWVGTVAARTALAGREAFYRASRDIGAATNPSEVVAAVGKHLAAQENERVSVWRISPRAGEDGSIELERLGSWAPLAAKPWPPGERLDATRMPALAGLRRRSSLVIREKELPPSERVEWGRQGLRSCLLVPLGAPGDGPDGLLVVASAKRRAYPRGRMRIYQTIGAQAILALENLRLIKQARESGERVERQRLAHEIHDTLIQGFASIVMNLEAAERLPGNSSARRHLDEARHTARESLAEARRIVWALRPEALEDASLPEALSRLAERWAEGSSVATDVTVTGRPRPLAPEAEVTLLRAAQEALTNVRKHAGANRVMLTLSYMEDRVTLDVKDDGAGFEPGRSGSTMSNGGFGLRAMRERVERSGGSLLVESEPGKGTVLAVELPEPPGRAS